MSEPKRTPDPQVRTVTVTRVVPHHLRFSQPTRVTYVFPGYYDRTEKK
jgi:hypothetical protein